MFNQLYFMGYCHYISYWEKKNEYINDPETKVIYQKIALKNATVIPSLPIMIPALLLSAFLFMVYVENPKLPMILSILSLMAIITFIFRKIYVTDDYAEETLKRYESTSKQDRKKIKRNAIFFFIIMFFFFIFTIVAGGRLASIVFR